MVCQKFINISEGHTDVNSCSLLLAGCLIHSLFYPGDGGNIFLRNTGELPDYNVTSQKTALFTDITVKTSNTTETE
jgi:hypothetical protein